MQAIKDLVCSDDPVNHQLGLMLAFTEYGKSFETFMMVLDWHSLRKRKSENWFTDMTISNDLCLYIDWSAYYVHIHFIDSKNIDLNLNCFVQNTVDSGYTVFKINVDKKAIQSTEYIKEQLKSIYHFLTYYDII